MLYRTIRNHVSRVMIAAGASVLTVACLGCPGQTGGTDCEFSDSNETVSFAQQVQPIFDAHCIACHVQGGFADGEGIALRLTSAESFGGLVNQNSVQDSTLTLVKPGDPGASLLFAKVSSASPPVGSRMPLGVFAAPLSCEDQALIRNWIAQGAKEN